MSKVSKLGESRELLPQSVLEVVEVDLDPLHLVLGSGLLDEGEEVGAGRGARLKDGKHVDLYVECSTVPFCISICVTAF